MVLISRRYPFQDGHSCQNKVQGPRSNKNLLILWYGVAAILFVPRCSFFCGGGCGWSGGVYLNLSPQPCRPSPPELNSMDLHRFPWSFAIPLSLCLAGSLRFSTFYLLHYQGSRIKDQRPRIKDHGPCFSTNEHPRRDTDVISRLPDTTTQDLSVFIGFRSQISSKFAFYMKI